MGRSGGKIYKISVRKCPMYLILCKIVVIVLFAQNSSFSEGVFVSFGRAVEIGGRLAVFSSDGSYYEYISPTF